MPECQKCGCPNFRGFDTRLREPWCEDCQRKFRDDYRRIRLEWVTKNAQVLLKEMGVPSVYRSCELGNFEESTNDQRRVKKAVQRWVDQDEPGLFLCGGCGTGKTHLAVAALLSLRGRGLRGQFASVQELLTECRDSFRNNIGLEEVLEPFSKASVILLDDLGTENPTRFSKETVAFVLDRAYRQQQVVIVTSNYDFEALAQRLDPRTVDRLIQICLPVKFNLPSYRQKLAHQRMWNQ